MNKYLYFIKEWGTWEGILSRRDLNGLIDYIIFKPSSVIMYTFTLEELCKLKIKKKGEK